MPRAQVSSPRSSGARITGHLDINALLAFAFGVIFLIAMLVMANVVTNPNGFQITVFMTALSLSAAGVGAVLPGFLEIQHKGFVRAGGALALFLIVWSAKPALEEKVVKLERPSASAEPAALKFLRKLDDQQPNEAYEDMDSQSKSDIGSDRFKELYKNVRGPMGIVNTRHLVHIQPATSPPGLPVGLYELLLYKTAFQGGICRNEAVSLRATSAKTWAVYGYTVSPPVPC